MPVSTGHFATVQPTYLTSLVLVKGTRAGHSHTARRLTADLRQP